MKTNHKISQKVSRRQFVSQALTATAGFYIVPRYVLGGKGFTAPSDEIVLGFIGTGKQSKGLQNNFMNRPGTRVIAGCDVDSLKLARFEQLARDYYAEKLGQTDYKGVKTFGDFNELLELSEIDAVVIATPDHWHAIQTVRAAAKGKDVYCEKPMAHTIEEGQAMIAAVKKYGRVFQTGSMQRSRDTFHKACELVRNGYIGDIKQVLVSVGPPPVSCDLPNEPTPDYLDWENWNGPAPKRGYHPELSPHISNDVFPHWRNYAEYGGGMVTDWGAHMFDIAQWGLGMDRSGPVRFVPPKGANPKEGMTFYYENGIEMIHKDFGRGNAVRFIGSKGNIDISRSFFESTPEGLVNTEIKAGDVRLYNSRDHYADWLEGIRNRTQPICDVETGHRTSSVCTIANIAYKLKRELNWDPKKEVFKKDKEANGLLGKQMRAPWSLSV